jgi:hypothetical protein
MVGLEGQGGFGSGSGKLRERTRAEVNDPETRTGAQRPVRGGKLENEIELSDGNPQQKSNE